MDPRLAQLFQGMGGPGGGAQVPDGPVVDASETVHISSLSLLKMLKHGALSVHPNCGRCWWPLCFGQIVCPSEVLKQNGLTEPARGPLRHTRMTSTPPLRPWQVAPACPWRSWGSCLGSLLTTTL